MSNIFNPDRRYQRTHESIINAAIELALAGGWEKVSVTKLADRANINRNSFYIHFETMNDVFDEIEERFLVKYRDFLALSPVLDVMIKDPQYYSTFLHFLKNEENYVAMINKIGRAEHLISKINKIWMAVYNEELDASPQYRKEKEIILPYIAGSTMIFFTSWINDPTGFDVRKNALFNGDFINHILTLASNKE